MPLISDSFTERQVQQFYDDVERGNLWPLWRNPLHPEPQPAMQPHLWRYEDYYPILLRAGEIMSPASVQGDDHDERRVLLLVSPELKQQTAATNTLVASVQFMSPGDVAPAHRHSITAIRFILQGRGAYSTVDGEKTIMETGDFLLTPNGTWHDHGNEGDEPTIWMDGLDRFLIQQLQASFFEAYPTGVQERSKPLGYSVNKYGPTNVRPIWELPPPSPAMSPQLCYKWDATEAALQRLARLGETNACGDVAVFYVNPLNGAHVLPTLGCMARLLTPSASTKAKRHTGSAVYAVYGGQGSSVINGVRLRWRKGDLFTIPPWAWYEHANESDTEDAFFFCLTDLPVFQALALYREEIHEENGGHQEVTTELNGAS